MKVLKLLIFSSIIGSILILIYKNSDLKGFRRLWVSIRIAIVRAATIAGLIPLNAKTTDSANPTQSAAIERVVEPLRGGFKPDLRKGQCKIVYRIKEDSGLVRAAEEACKNEDVQKDVNHLEEQ